MGKCKNCGDEVVGNFCCGCGQKVDVVEKEIVEMEKCKNCGYEGVYQNTSIELTEGNFCFRCGEDWNGDVKNWKLKIILLSALGESEYSPKASMSVEELKGLIEVKKLKKLSMISNILLFFLVTSLAGAAIFLIYLSGMQ